MSSALDANRTHDAAPESALVARSTDASRRLLSAPATILALQRASGNRQVARMLAGSAQPVLAVQRLIEGNDFAEALNKAGQSTTGKNVLLDATNALRTFHRENVKKEAADKKVLIEALETVIAKCKAWIAIGKSASGPDAARTTVVNNLLTAAKAELGTRDPSKAEVPPPAAAVVPPPIPTLPAVRPTKLLDRLDWMDIKRQQTDATPAQKASEPRIREARKLTDMILRRQALQMQVDQLNKEEKFTQAGQKQMQANRIVVPGGEGALSALLGKLFVDFAFTPLSFAGGGGKTAQEQQTAFVAKAKELLGALQVRVGTEVRTGFDDVELIVAGSSTLGHSPHKGTNFGAQSDVDVSAVSPKLLAALKAAGVAMRGLGDRTEADPTNAIRNISAQLKPLAANRKVSIMVYGSRDAAQRQVGVQI